MKKRLRKKLGLGEFAAGDVERSVKLLNYYGEYLQRAMQQLIRYGSVIVDEDGLPISVERAEGFYYPRGAVTNVTTSVYLEKFKRMMVRKPRA